MKQCFSYGIIFGVMFIAWGCMSGSSPFVAADASPRDEVETGADGKSNTNAGADTETDADTPVDADTKAKPETDVDAEPAYINLGATDWAPHTRIVALGDNHADLSRVKRALQIGGVLGESLNWIGKNTIVVQVGDVIDRGTEDRELIDYYESLRIEAEAEGGQIINMLGNHEIMTARGDYRYMHPGACAAFADRTDLDISNPAFEGLTDENCKRRAAAFWPGGPYAKIIADWPVAVVLERILFVHGGFHQHHADYGIDNLNRMTEAWLNGEGDLNTAYVGGGEDILPVDWDRTYSSELPLADDMCMALQGVLEQVGAERMVVGHTIQAHINGVCNDHVVRIDTGMSEIYGGGIEVLEIINGVGQVLVDPA